MSADQTLRVGLCGIGLDAYWSQFAGLEDRLKGYVAQVAFRLEQESVDVVNLGLVDTPQSSRDAGRACRRNDIDLLFLYVTTYALSNTVLPLVQRAAVPVVVLNLQPAGAIDYGHRSFARTIGTSLERTLPGAAGACRCAVALRRASLCVRGPSNVRHRPDRLA